MSIISVSTFVLFLFSSFYLHAAEEEKVLDKCIVKIKLKNSDVSYSIYQSDVESMVSYHKMTSGRYNKEEILDDILKHKVAMLFGKKPSKEEMEMVEKQVNKQIQLQINSILDQCGGDSEIFQKQLGGTAIEEYENKIRKTQIENFLFQHFLNANPTKEDVSLDEIKEYYLKKKENGNLKTIPEKYEYWEIKIKTHNYKKANEVLNFLSKNEWDLSNIKKEIKGEIKVGRIDREEYGNAKCFLPQNVREIIFNMKEGAISDVIKTSKGLFIIKKIKDKGEKNFCCEYVLILSKDKREYKQDILTFWDVLLKEIKKKGEDIENTLSQLSRHIRNNPKASEKMFNNFEVVITKDPEKMDQAGQKKIFSTINEGEFTKLTTANNSDNSSYTCYYLTKKIKEHVENLEEDFNRIKNELKYLIEEKETTNLIRSCLKNTEISYDDSIDYVKVLKKYL